MKNYKVLLCDYEEVFVAALMNYINRNSNLPILTMAFTDITQMMNYCNSHQADLLVMNAKWKDMNRISEEAVTVPILWITDGEVSEEAADDHISKYSSAPAYGRKMLRLLSEQEVSVGGEGSCICMAVYSPLGRCGKTRLSHALCMAYRGSGPCLNERHIYIGMEEYGNPESDYHGMETLLYYVKNKTGNLSMKMKSLAVEVHGYDMLASALTYQELRELQQQELQWMLECIRREGYYDLLLADLGTACFAELRLLTEFDVIYLPYLQDENSIRKLQAFCRGVKQYGLWEKLSEVCYPVLLENHDISVEEAQLLEAKREKGDIPALGHLCERLDLKYV